MQSRERRWQVCDELADTPSIESLVLLVDMRVATRPMPRKAPTRIAAGASRVLRREADAFRRYPYRPTALNAYHAGLRSPLASRRPVYTPYSAGPVAGR